MAENKEQVIIDIQTNYDEAIMLMAKYRAEADKFRKAHSDLKKEVKEGAITQEEYQVEVAKNTVQMKTAADAASTWERTIRNSLKVDQEKIGSVRQLQAQIKALKEQYKSMSEEERKSAKGQELKKKINDVANSLNEAGEEIQEFQQHVGNYENAIKNALSSSNPFAASLMKLTGNANNTREALANATTSVKAFGKALLTLALNPIVLVITAIVGAATLLYNLFKKFDPIVDKVEQGLSALSAVFSTIVDRVRSLIIGQIKLTEVFKGLGDAMGKAAKQGQEYKKTQQELEDMQNLNIESNAKYQRQINELILQSKDRTKSEKERQALIDQALVLENKQYQERKAIADKEVEEAELRIIKGRNLTNEQIREYLKR
mgnify:CR=1 FL=1